MMTDRPARPAAEDDGLALAETVAARACHDLGGLVGALLGTLELAEEEPGATEALTVSLDAARTLAGRVRLLRAAWGGGDCGNDPAALAELLSHAAGFPRKRTDWSAMGSEIDPALSRVLLNAALVATESLPRGGTAHVAPGAAGEARITLEGAGAAWPPDWADAIASGAPQGVPADSRSLQRMLTILFARADGVALSWDRDGVPPVLVLRN